MAEGENLYFAVEAADGYKLARVTANGEELSLAEAANDADGAFDGSGYSYVYAVEAVGTDQEILIEMEEALTVYSGGTEDAFFMVDVPDGAFEEEVKLQVSKIEGEEELAELEKRAEETLKDKEAIAGIRAYDVSFVSAFTGQEVQPKKAVSVRFQFKETAVAEGAEKKEITEISIVHLPEGEKPEVVAITEDAEETEFGFDLESFSPVLAISKINEEKPAPPDYTDFQRYAQQTGKGAKMLVAAVCVRYGLIYVMEDYYPYREGTLEVQNLVEDMQRLGVRITALYGYDTNHNARLSASKSFVEYLVKFGEVKDNDGSVAGKDKEEYPWMCETAVDNLEVVKYANTYMRSQYGINGPHYLYSEDYVSDADTTKWFWNKKTGKWETTGTTTKFVLLKHSEPGSSSKYVRMTQSEIVANCSEQVTYTVSIENYGKSQNITIKNILPEEMTLENAVWRKAGDKTEDAEPLAVDKESNTVSVTKKLDYNGRYELQVTAQLKKGYVGSLENRFEALDRNNKSIVFESSKTAPVKVVSKYQLKYDANCGKDKVTEMPEETEDSRKSAAAKQYDFTISNNVPKRDLYNFQGWAEEPDAKVAQYGKAEDGTVLTDKISVKWPEKDPEITLPPDLGSAENPVTKTLYAVWKPKDALAYAVTKDEIGSGSKAEWNDFYELTRESFGETYAYALKDLQPVIGESSDGEKTYTYTIPSVSWNIPGSEDENWYFAGWDPDPDGAGRYGTNAGQIDQVTVYEDKDGRLYIKEAVPDSEKTTEDTTYYKEGSKKIYEGKDSRYDKTSYSDSRGITLFPIWKNDSNNKTTSYQIIHEYYTVKTDPDGKEIGRRADGSSSKTISKTSSNKDLKVGDEITVSSIEKKTSFNAIEYTWESTSPEKTLVLSEKKENNKIRLIYVNKIPAEETDTSYTVIHKYCTVDSDDAVLNEDGVVTENGILGEIGQEITVQSIEQKNLFNDKEYEYHNSDPEGSITLVKDCEQNMITLIYWRTKVEEPDKEPDPEPKPDPEPTPTPPPTPSVPSGTSGGGGGRSSGGSTSSSASKMPVTMDLPEVPLASFPEQPVLEEIEDLDVPLIALPKTGDSRHTGMLLFMMGMAGFGMLISAMGLKKSKED